MKKKKMFIHLKNMQRVWSTGRESHVKTNLLALLTVGRQRSANGETRL